MNKTDFDLAMSLFKKLHEKGVEITINDYSGRKANFDGNVDVEFDWNSVYFEFINSNKQASFTFDFINKEFYRISGYTDGHWQDEFDWKKY